MVSQDTIINKLRELARNLWWTWQPHVIELFRELDPVLWRETDHNPVVFLDRIPPEQLVRRASEMALISRIDYAFRRLNEYLENKDSWGAVHASTLRSRPVAYFSMEFGLHESLPIYSGGLGVLAGDHLKSASDLGLPLVAVGILYAEGYFRQALDAEGWQHENYPYNEPSRLPIEEALAPDGTPVRVAVDTRTGTLHAKVWRVEVGRTTLLLLDSNVPENGESDRALTGRLYGGNAGVRIRQELLLGVGGVRALFASGIDPSVIHLNEGHSAFAGLELIRRVMEDEGRPFGEAVRQVAAMTVFTTHTPVAAGHDRFGSDLVEENLGILREQLHLPFDDFNGLGRVHPGDHNEPFCMTVLALKLSRHANGVSALHGKVSRQMWHPLYPSRTEEEVPIGHITNGVHVLSWLAPQMKSIYDRHLGRDWTHRMRHPEVWSGASEIDDGEFWETHQVLKARLLEFVRQRLARQAANRGAGDAEVAPYQRMFDLDTLTIGFARRFATYKRATLVMKDAEKLAALVNSSNRPVQLLFAGKAHPEDRYGKEFIKEIVRISNSSQFRGRLAFIEDYDMNVARFLVQGVDVWLNNPRRPQEASGTSGQKVAMNGGLNCSILDGWWAEGYDGRNGFAIGSGRTHADPRVQDERDYDDLIAALSSQVVPLYYDRDASGLPRKWIARVKDCIRTLGWRFNSDRQVMDYAQFTYLPASGGQPCEMPGFHT
ncbi:alpha-glucan family phosphorylase [Tautonia plasticadhaerens]|uniref:Maltodextrin phosphorylase n=1 Tax=Tautonia plasticadhaerens TaxID=2527974 RepID=A0A518H1W6_9BACT|nr:alpha-glucan family phosphorylase [Tautonia plasticadhaerens]QDV34836.1 Maltodextrin phosphorylase [Tautonia plasticadhaerens]